MKKPLSAFLLLGACYGPLPAAAAVSIQELALGQTDTNVIVRITLANSDPQPQRGPLKLTLFVRKNARSPWLRARVWKGIEAVPASGSVTREEFSENNPVLDSMIKSVNWEARVIVDSSKGRLAERSNGFYNDSAVR